MGEKIEISIRRRRRHAVPRPLRGSIDISREPDYLKRRLRQGGINFYDLGQISDGHGGWGDADYLVLVDVRFEGDRVFPGRDLVAADFSALDAAILGVTGDLKTKARKFVKGSIMSVNWELNVSAASFSGKLEEQPNWTASGLQVAQSDLNDGLIVSSLDSRALTGELLLLDDARYKITTLPAFAAASVAFTPSPKMDVFLMPCFAVQGAYLSWVDALGELHRDALNYFYSTYLRDWVVNPSSPYYLALTTGFSGYDSFYRGIQAMQVFPGTRSYHADVHFHTIWSSSGTFVMGPPLTVPPTLPPRDPTAGGTTTMGARYYSFDSFGWASMEYSVAPYPEGQSGILTGIVSKGGITYYFWTA